MEIPVFGKEQYPLNRESGLSYTISDIYKHVPIHTHNHYELFIISEGTAYHMINDSVQTVRRFASSCSRNGINEAAIDAIC